MFWTAIIGVGATGAPAVVRNPRLNLAAGNSPIPRCDCAIALNEIILNVNATHQKCDLLSTGHVIKLTRLKLEPKRRKKTHTEYVTLLLGKESALLQYKK